MTFSIMSQDVGTYLKILSNNKNYLFRGRGKIPNYHSRISRDLVTVAKGLVPFTKVELNRRDLTYFICT